MSQEQVDASRPYGRLFVGLPETNSSTLLRPVAIQLQAFVLTSLLLLMYFSSVGTTPYAVSRL